MSLFGGLEPARPGIPAYWVNCVECFAISPGAALIVISFGDYFVFGTGGGTAVGDGRWLTDMNSKGCVDPFDSFFLVTDIDNGCSVVEVFPMGKIQTVKLLTPGFDAS